MISRKIRRHSGRVYPTTTVKAKKRDIINACLDPQEHWSDWDDYRDSMRSPNDKTKLRKISAKKGAWYQKLNIPERAKFNKKIKKETRIRKVRKIKRWFLRRFGEEGF